MIQLRLLQLALLPLQNILFHHDTAGATPQRTSTCAAAPCLRGWSAARFPFSITPRFLLLGSMLAWLVCGGVFFGQLAKGTTKFTEGNVMCALRTRALLLLFCAPFWNRR